MTIAARFNRTANAAPAAAANARTPARRTSRYAGIQAATPRDPMLDVGTYRLRVLSHEERLNKKNGNETFRTTFEVVAVAEGTHAVGDHVVTIHMLNGNGAAAGMARIKSQVMAEAGFAIDQEDQYDAFDPNGDFFESLVGVDNEYTQRGETTVGNLVDVVVRRGNDDGRGGYYRDYDWLPVTDESGE